MCGNRYLQDISKADNDRHLKGSLNHHRFKLLDTRTIDYLFRNDISYYVVLLCRNTLVMLFGFYSGFTRPVLHSTYCLTLFVIINGVKLRECPRPAHACLSHAE